MAAIGVQRDDEARGVRRIDVIDVTESGQERGAGDATRPGDNLEGQAEALRLASGDGGRPIG